jgi:hypothetical protein
MNNATFKARLALNAGNLQPSDPRYANLQAYVSDGIRFTITRACAKFPNYELFPELRDIEWIDVTIADQDYLPLPSDHFAVQRAFSADQSTNPVIANESWRLLTYVEPQDFDQLVKGTTQLAWPTLYTLRENRIYFNQTPRTGWTTYVKIDGVEDEPDMVNPTDVPRTNIRWHPAILDSATHLLLTDMGWPDADRFIAAADEKIGDVVASSMGLRRANTRKTLRMSGMPRRSV